MSPHASLFLDRTAGVLALVALTATVVWGLIAADCLAVVPLTARARLLAQAVHRALGVGALGFLAVHIAVKTAEGHAGAAAALLPFSSGALLGLGALAGYLLVLAAATGALRSAFVGRGRLARRWRVVHSCAYPAWCAALPHGLKAGRAPATWVTVCYALCLAAVAAALAFRALAAAPAGRRVRNGVRAAMRPGTRPGRGRRAARPVRAGSALGRYVTGSTRARRGRNARGVRGAGNRKAGGRAGVPGEVLAAPPRPGRHG
ncbi:hypothetical protein [Streptomyces orinoci]|uniref:Integral membrane protein n=1 Tax=Streptomyces orinoci TaxID=67339 RepID=A0ABV3JQE0_STRON